MSNAVIDASSMEEEIRPLPSRIRLNPQAAPVAENKPATKRLPVEAVKPENSNSKPTKNDENDIVKPLLEDNDEVSGEDVQSSPSKSDDNASTQSKEGPFGGSTKYYLIFLAVIFGTLLLVWMIGGEDEVTVDYLDQQYSILGLEPSATDDQVKSAFKKMAMKFHPDKCSLSDCAKKFIDVEKARDSILKWGAYFRARRVVGTNFAPQR
jgi:hypothetical protein